VAAQLLEAAADDVVLDGERGAFHVNGVPAVTRSWAEVAGAAGVAPSTVVHLFGTVRAVAASTWVRHVPELEAIAASPLADDDDPMLRIEAVLVRIAELIREAPGAGEAIFGQVLADARPGSTAPKVDFRVLVPVPDFIEPAIRTLRERGRLRRHVECDRLARTVIHLLAMHTLLFRDDSVERVVDEVVAVFDGALVTRSTG